MTMALITGCPPSDGAEGEGEGEGEVCIDPGDGIFPVKVLVAMDTSGSLDFVDPDNRRLDALQEALTALAAQPATSVAVIGFGAGIEAVPAQAVGTPAFGTVTAAPAFLELSATQTDHEGALLAIAAHLRKDFEATTDAGLRARTRVVVVMVTDGTSSPVCCVEGDERLDERGPTRFDCPAESFEVDQPGVTFCEGEAEQALCDDQAFLTRFQEATPPTADAPDYGSGQTLAIAGLDVGLDYNRPATLSATAASIAALGDEFGVGAIDFGGVLVQNPSLDDGVREIFRLNDCVAEGTIAAIAEGAGGTHRVVDVGAPFTLGIDATSLADQACTP
jgi:hypothetical protein